MKNFARVMDGELPCIVQGQTALDLEGLAELSLEFDLPLVILDGREAWTMTGRLARAKISVILAPRQRGEGGNEPTRFYEQPSGWSIETAAKLEAARRSVDRALAVAVRQHGRNRGPRPHAAQPRRGVHGPRRRDRGGRAARRHALGGGDPQDLRPGRQPRSGKDADS